MAKYTYNYPTRNCAFCSKKFDPKKPNQKFCCDKCYKSFYYKPSKHRKYGISPGTVGSIAELLASVDLMSKGYEVYRALSPSSSCDILVLKDGKSYTFEIRTGYYGAGKNVLYTKKNIKADNLIVITFDDDKIHYLPDLSNAIARS